MVQLNKDSADIKEMIAVKGCPPDLQDALKALHQAGIDVNPAFFDNMDMAAGFFMKKFEGKPEFEESFFRIL